MQTIERIRVLAPGTERLPCHTIPFYGWLTADTWGEPTTPEIFEFAIKPA